MEECVTHEGSFSEEEKSSCDKSGGNKQVQLWNFLLNLLENPCHAHVITWGVKPGEFTIKKPHEVAKMWGEKKKKPAMTYEKLSRALRYYYDKDILDKAKGRRFTYQFNMQVLEDLQSRSKGSSEETCDEVLQQKFAKSEMMKQEISRDISQQSDLIRDQYSENEKRNFLKHPTPVRPIPLFPQKGPQHKFEHHPVHSELNDALLNWHKLSSQSLPASPFHTRLKGNKDLNGQLLIDPIFFNFLAQKEKLLQLNREKKSYFLTSPTLHDCDVFNGEIKNGEIKNGEIKNGEIKNAKNEDSIRMHIEEEKSKLSFSREFQAKQKSSSVSQSFNNEEFHRSLDNRRHVLTPGRHSFLLKRESLRKVSEYREHSNKFSFERNEIEAYQDRLHKSNSRFYSSNSRATRCYSETSTERSLLSPSHRTTGNKDVRMVELKRPTLEELKYYLKKSDEPLSCKQNTQYQSPIKHKQSNLPYIELKRWDFDVRNEKTADFKEKSLPVSCKQFTSTKNQRSTSKENPTVIIEDVFKEDVNSMDQTEPLNLSCSKQRTLKEKFQQRNSQTFNESPRIFHEPNNKSNYLSPSSPNVPNDPPLTPFLYSPMKRLHLSDSFAPIPQSPNRKRQNSSSIKKLSSSADIGDAFIDLNDLKKDPIFAKIGRLSCKSESHVIKPTNQAHSHVIKQTNQRHSSSTNSSLQHVEQYKSTSRVRKKSLSLPNSPHRSLPLKWRLKQRKASRGSDYSREMSSAKSASGRLKNEISQQQVQLGPHDSDNDYVITQSRDKTLRAYQNSDCLIVVADEDVHPKNNEKMETNQESEPDVIMETSKKIFRTPSEEIQEIYNSKFTSEHTRVQTEINNNCPTNSKNLADHSAQYSGADISNNPTKYGDKNVELKSTKVQELVVSETSPSKLKQNLNCSSMSSIEDKEFKHKDPVVEESETTVNSIKKDPPRPLSGGFINALLTTREKSRSCPSTPTRGLISHFQFAPIR